MEARKISCTVPLAWQMFGQSVKETVSWQVQQSLYTESEDEHNTKGNSVNNIFENPVWRNTEQYLALT